MNTPSPDCELDNAHLVFLAFLDLAKSDRYALVSASDVTAALRKRGSRSVTPGEVEAHLQQFEKQELIIARGFPGTYSVSALGLRTQKLPAFTVDAKRQPREAAVSQRSTFIDASTHHHTTNASTTINQSGASPQLQVASGNGQNSSQSRNDPLLQEINAKLAELEKAFQQDLKDKDAALKVLTALQQTTSRGQVSVPEVKSAWKKFGDSLPTALGGQIVSTAFDQSPKILDLFKEIGSLIKSYTSSGT